jgi:exonuclease III
MRIVVWNCKMAFSRKWQFLQNLSPDIAVIPECSKNSIETAAKCGFDCRWFGENPHKGLGVLIAKPWVIVESKEPQNKWIVPLQISGPANFLLIAVWASQVSKNPKDNYIVQVHRAVKANPGWFNGQPVVLCGDFNSNAIWDKKRKEGNHSAVVKFLADRNIVSAYHHFFLEDHGRETRPTHYLWHHENRSFHIDYVFLPENWATRIREVEVGKYLEWTKFSDHVPLVVNLD